ncbi:unnamed protein product, partial [Rotaria magnacalcarata]
MNNTELISVLDYLRLSNSKVHELHLIKVRDCYRKVLQLSTDDLLPEDPNEEAIGK